MYTLTISSMVMLFGTTLCKPLIPGGDVERREGIILSNGINQPVENFSKADFGRSSNNALPSAAIQSDLLRAVKSSDPSGPTASGGTYGHTALDPNSMSVDEDQIDSLSMPRDSLIAANMKVNSADSTATCSKLSSTGNSQESMAAVETSNSARVRTSCSSLTSSLTNFIPAVPAIPAASTTTITESITDTITITVYNTIAAASSITLNRTSRKILNSSMSARKTSACTQLKSRSTRSTMMPPHTNSNLGINLSTSTTSTYSNNAAPSASTPSGVLQGCTQYYVPRQREYCAEVAQKFGISVDTFMAWNPSLNRSTCPLVGAGHSYCVARCDDVAMYSTSATLAFASSMVVPASSTSSKCSDPPLSTLENITVTVPSSAPATSTSRKRGINAYNAYSGNGSTAAGWPAVSDWVDFDCMFSDNIPQMQASCAQWGVSNDSITELADLRQAISSIATSSGIDERFILAIVLQESKGCVRVIATQYGVLNPGLMQSHNGSGTCNYNTQPLNVPGTNTSLANVRNPCPYSEIFQMIHDGVEGTPSGDGLVQCMQKQNNTDDSRWYRTARMYNGGSIEDPADLGQGCCTASYASDVANRLTGWTTAPRDFIE